VTEPFRGLATGISHAIGEKNKRLERATRFTGPGTGSLGL
jgi:hypothetical protein